MITLSVLTPIAFALCLAWWRGAAQHLRPFVFIALTASAALSLLPLALYPDSYTRSLFSLTGTIPFLLRIDSLSRVFVLLIDCMYVLVGIYALEYLEHDAHPARFYIFFLASWGALLAAALAGNLVSLYLCFEMATLTSMPLVLHEGTREATLAALKYLFYSIGGALMGLFAVMSLCSIAVDTFTYGGYLPLHTPTPLVLWASFLGILGFGAKAGLYPLHGWLPTAHPVAPAPASALLSGMVAKAGVLAIIRLVYYSVGPDLLRGTWVQTAWMVLGLTTVFMGSMMAFRERVLKKRLAYSTVSQISYILLGLSLLCDAGLQGAIQHVLAHAVSKGALFLCAGVVIHTLHRTRVDELRGIGRALPVTCFCFFLASLSLVGIPPMGGFLSKWAIAQAALAEAPGPFRLLIPLMLLLSALLTAGYLLPVVVYAYFPVRGEASETDPALAPAEPGPLMLVPLGSLCLISLLVGLGIGLGLV